MSRAFHEYQAYGTLFIEELLSTPKQWDKIRENLSAKLSFFKENDINALYKQAVLDKQFSIILELNNLVGKDNNYDSLVAQVLTQPSIWFMAFQANDKNTIQALSSYSGFNSQFLNQLLSTPRYGNFGTAQTFIAELIERKCFQTLEFLLDNGVPCDAFDTNHNSLINIACEHHQYQLVEKILKTGFPVNFQNSHNNDLYPSPLHSVFLSKDKGAQKNPKDLIKTLEILFQYGADPNITDQYTNSPLFYAIYMPVGCTKEVLKLFIEHGVDFNQKGNYNFNLIEQFKHVKASMVNDSIFYINATQMLDNVDILREKHKIQSSLGAGNNFKENKNIFKI